MPGLQTFSGFLHNFVLAKLALSSTRVKRISESRYLIRHYFLSFDIFIHEVNKNAKRVSLSAKNSVKTIVCLTHVYGIVCLNQAWLNVCLPSKVG